MSLLFIALTLLFSDLDDPENKREKSTTTAMEVTVEVVPGSLLFDQLTHSVQATSNDQKYQIGFKEFTISFPAESEVITGNVTKQCSTTSDCSSYMVSNLEKLDAYTGKVKIHYLVGNSDDKKRSTKKERHTATIIYL